MEIEKVKAALTVLVAEIRRLEAEVKVSEDPMPIVEALAFLHAVRVATIKKLAATV